MDIRNLFASISREMSARFDQSSQVRHSGGKGSIREDHFLAFLKQYMPTRYALGRGEVVTPQNRTSGQLDVVIYDPARCPVLMPSESHAVFPIESAYGAVSVKSRLNASELQDAYKNIESLKRIVSREGFTSSLQPGFMVGVTAPTPVTGIFAYAADRSLEAIKKQVEELDAAMLDVSLRPDFVAVLGQGIVGPVQQLRNQTNAYQLLTIGTDLAHLSKTGRHTLLRLYMKLLDECNTIILRPLNLKEYLDMPKLIGKFRVHRTHFVRFKGVPLTEELRVKTLTERAVEAIVNLSVLVTRRQNFLNWLAMVPDGPAEALQLDEIIYEYNPRNLPPVDMSQFKFVDGNLAPYEGEAFWPIQIEIDGLVYSVDFNSLPEGSFEFSTDLTADEFFAQ